MNITSDWHIHSRNSCDGACMAVADLICGAEKKGVLDFGLTDHVHTPYNFPDIDNSRKEYLAIHPSPRFHFGVEVSCVSQWELDQIASGRYEDPVYGLRSGGPVGGSLAIGMNREDVERYEIEYLVGGTHWPMYAPLERESVIRDYHRQNIFLATHPLIDIVAHPWWWMGHWADDDGNFTAEPWFDDFGAIPGSMHDEFAAAAVDHGTLVEINLSANLLNPHYPKHFVRQYLDYLAELKSRGVRLCVGSDCHSARYEIDFETTSLMLESVGIDGVDLWSFPPRGGGESSSHRLP